MRLTIVMTAFGDGGVERMVVNTARGLAERGVDVEFVMSDTHGPFIDQLGPKVRLSTLPYPRLPRSWRLARHLRQRRPHALLVAKARDARLALAARSLSRIHAPLIMRPGTTVSERVAARSRLHARWKLRRLRRLYRHADAIVANSAGVRDDIAGLLATPPRRIWLIRNPVITPELDTLASEPVDDPWLRDPEIPLILGAGGLRRQKDFPTLIRAFARLRRERGVRLLILGRGRLEEHLRTLIADLGLDDEVRLGGFVPNPYPYLAGCDLFVLSSRWEGSPNVLTEALALGTPVVATDCRSGPREILQDGRIGRLVTVGDDAGLAEAMAATLDAPSSSDQLRNAVAQYTMEHNAESYHELLRHTVDASHG